MHVGGFGLRGGQTRASVQHLNETSGRMSRKARKGKVKCTVTGAQVEGPLGTGRAGARGHVSWKAAGLGGRGGNSLPLQRRSQLETSRTRL